MTRFHVQDKSVYAPLTESTDPEGYFVYWKCTSSPGSHPTENRSCPKDLWVGLLPWGICFIYHVVERKLRLDQQKMHIQGDVFHFPQKCSVFENNDLFSSKIMLTNTGK